MALKSLFKKSNIFLFIIFTAFIAIRAFTLDYNSLSNDEALLILVGKMGLFEGNWYAYNAKNWLHTNQYIFPVITAVLYNYGGIQLARLFSVFVGGLTCINVFLITNLLKEKAAKELNSYVAPVFAALSFCFAGIIYFTSRIATYDIYSVYFLTLAVYFLIKAHFQKIDTQNISNNHLVSKYYFCAFMTLTLSYLLNYIMFLYVPALLIGIFLFNKQTVEETKKQRELNIKFFTLPTIIFLTIFSVFNLNSIKLYLSNQLMVQQLEPLAVINIMANHSLLVVLFSLLGISGFIFNKKFKLLAILLLLALLIPLSNLVLSRAVYAEVNLISFVFFMSVIIGLGIDGLINLAPSKFVKTMLLGVYSFILITFIGFNIIQYRSYNNIWNNTSYLSDFMSFVVENDTKVLTQEGSIIILETFDTNNPTNNTTYNWFDYKDKSDIDAYKTAVTDAYFDYIQITSKSISQSQLNNIITDTVLSALEDKYELIYVQEPFYVYRKK